MKIGFTINIGNYENVKIESNELPTLDDCLLEVYKSLRNLSQVDAHIEEFMSKDYFDIIRKVVEGI